MSYAEYLARKKPRMPDAGFDPPALRAAAGLRDYQQQVVDRMLRQGRGCVFADCGAGKTRIELEWARSVAEHTGRPVLVLTPLAVGRQMRAEAAEMGIRICRQGESPCEHLETEPIPVDGTEYATELRCLRCGRPTASNPPAMVQIANYQRLHHFDPGDYAGIVLDESSILKDLRGATREALTEWAAQVPFRLAATATPAPNDIMELLTHAEWLGVMTVQEAQGTWMVNDASTAGHSWRLKGHAVADFWRWVRTWASIFRRPSDLGCPDPPGYDPPPYRVEKHFFDGALIDESGRLFAHGGLAELRRARKLSLPETVQRIAALVAAGSERFDCLDCGAGVRADDDGCCTTCGADCVVTQESWVIWCELNVEADALAKAITGAVNLHGSLSDDAKEAALEGFVSGEHRVLITKPGIAGHGMNWQHCARMAWCGMGYSYERVYQAVRRCWRHGQAREVVVHVVGDRSAEHAWRVVQSKETEAMQLYDSAEAMRRSDARASIGFPDSMQRRESGDGWRIMEGDSVETVTTIDDASIGLSVFSPPFPGMYVYSDHPADMGNVQSIDEMVEGFGHLAERMLPKMIPGRSCLIHITQATAQKLRDGYIGLRDFRGPLIAEMVRRGWIHYGEICIDKNPQVKAVRTKDRGLMFVSLDRDAADMHVAMADMLLQFRAPGDNPEPVKPECTREEWIRWARPIWTGSDADDDGIRETDTLNAAIGREASDERHICPLQLGLIRRAVRLWSNRGDLVYSPFAGIGSEGVVAVSLGRRFAGGELKPSYYAAAVEHVRAAAAQGMFW